MKRQIPREMSIFIILAALFAGFWALGYVAPRSATEAQDQKLRAALNQITVPDIQGTTIDGKPFRLADYKGKPVLLNFWATWCGPCQLEIPDLIKLQQEFGPQGLTVVGLSEDTDVAPVTRFVQQRKINYPVLITPESVAKALQVQGLPTSYLIGRDGKIAYMTPGVFEGQSMRDVWAPEIQKVL